MALHYLELMTTPEVARAQEHYYGRSISPGVGSSPDILGQEELDFIATRDSFYLGTVTETGWPYIQHRGGTPGFLQPISPSTLAFADYRGNRQMLSTGNLATNDRVSLFLMDYPRRERLKLMGHSRVVDAKEHPEVAAKLIGAPGMPVERIVYVHVVGFDWNCPKHITPRYTAAEVEELVAPLRRRIAELESALQIPKAKG